MGRRLTDCFWIFIGFGRGGLRIVYGFLPDLGEEACGLCADVYRIWGRWGLWIFTGIAWRRRLTDCVRMFTGFGGGGLRIVRGCLQDLGEEAYGFLPELHGGGGLRIVYGFWPDLGRRLTDCLRIFYRIWGRRLTDCLRILTECKGGGLRMVYGFLPDWGEEAYGFLPDVEDEAYGMFTDLYRIWGRRLADCL